MAKSKGSKANLALILLCSVLAVLVVSVFLYHQKYVKDVERHYLASENECEGLPKEQIAIVSQGDHKMLVDRFHNFQFSIENLPEFTLGDLGCARNSYDFELYNMREKNNGSVARVNMRAPRWVNTNASLEDIAKIMFDYVEGQHADPEGGNYNQPFTSTPLEEKTLANGIQMISWENHYTDEATHREGTTASKEYLLLVGDKVYSFSLISWDIPSFNKAVTEFDIVINSFESPIVKSR
jgi:hypothetical protein